MREEDVENAYRVKLGARLDKTGDYPRYFIPTNGSERKVGHISHSWRGHLDNWQVSRLAKEMGVSVRDFEDFVTCKLSGKEILARSTPSRPTPRPKAPRPKKRR